MMIYDFQNLSSLNLGLIQFLGQQSVGDFRIFFWFSKSTWREQVWSIHKVQRWCLSNFSTLKYYVSLLNWVLAHQKFKNLGIFVMYSEEKHCHMALMIIVGVLKFWLYIGHFFSCVCFIHCWRSGSIITNFLSFLVTLAELGLKDYVWNVYELMLRKIDWLK